MCHYWFMFLNTTLLSYIDPETEHILSKVEEILFPIIYAVAGMALIFTGVKYGFKIHSEPEERGKHIKNMVWSFLGIMIVFLATGVGHIILRKYLSI